MNGKYQTLVEKQAVIEGGPTDPDLAAAVASLHSGGNGLGPINKIRKAVGIDRIRILPADPTKGQKSSVAVEYQAWTG